MNYLYEYIGVKAMFKKLFTDWKKSYAVFLPLLLLFEVFLVSITFIFEKPINGFVIFCLSSLFILFHVLFVLCNLEKDALKAQNKKLTLKEFSDKYEVSEERALWLLKEGKINGTISFEDIVLPNQSKKMAQKLKKATE